MVELAPRRCKLQYPHVWRKGSVTWEKGFSPVMSLPPPHLLSFLSGQEVTPLWHLCVDVLHVLWTPEQLTMKHLFFQLR